MEGLSGTAFLLVPGNDADQRGLHLFDRHGADHPVDEGGVGSEGSPEPDVDCLLYVLVDVGNVTPKSDIRDLGVARTTLSNRKSAFESRPGHRRHQRGVVRREPGPT